jgi:hypothetical protein
MNINLTNFDPGASERSASETSITEEVELYETSRERQIYDDQANLYAIILATEHLERAYARDAVTQKEVRTVWKQKIKDGPQS